MQTCIGFRTRDDKVFCRISPAFLITNIHVQADACIHGSGHWVFPGGSLVHTDEQTGSFNFVCSADLNENGH